MECLESTRKGMVSVKQTGDNLSEYKYWVNNILKGKRQLDLSNKVDY